MRIKKKPVLANRLLCFVACGLSTTYKIPTAYFFTNCLKSKELYEILLQVCREIKAVGRIVTITVSDNLSVNNRMYRILSASGKVASDVKAPLKINPVIEHPYDKD